MYAPVRHVAAARDAAEPSGCPSRCCTADDHSAASSTPGREVADRVVGLLERGRVVRRWCPWRAVRDGRHQHAAVGAAVARRRTGAVERDDLRRRHFAADVAFDQYRRRLVGEGRNELAEAHVAAGRVVGVAGVPDSVTVRRVVLVRRRTSAAPRSNPSWNARDPVEAVAVRAVLGAVDADGSRSPSMPGERAVEVGRRRGARRPGDVRQPTRRRSSRPVAPCTRSR